MLMNFGPINQSGGEKRLNVAFSRAKHHMAVVSSIQPAEIRNDYNAGAGCMKNYLRYAAALSAGDAEGANRVLRELAAGRSSGSSAPTEAVSVVTAQLAEALAKHGYHIELDVGMSSFRCDMAVRREGDIAYRLGILVDSTDYYQQQDILERDLMKPRLLEIFGWRVTHVLAKDWYQDRGNVLARILKLVENPRSPETTDGTPADTGLRPVNVDALLERVAIPDEPEQSIDLAIAEPTPADDDEDGNGSASVPAGKDAKLVEGKPLRLEYQEGASSKFWEIRQDGPYLTVRFGRIGSDGQSKVKKFASLDEAAAEGSKLIRRKSAKGYRPTT